MDILRKIISTKCARLEAAKGAISESQLRQQAIAVRRSAKPHALVKALRGDSRVKIIAEFKRRSPSQGVIRDDVSAETMARFYESGGAAAISVLTEEDFFGGSLEDLRSVRNTVSLPVLRKDFIFDEYQIYESAVAGADALLLIAAALDDHSLVNLRRITEDELKLDALVEVHTKEELRRATAVGSTLIGVNNRDLKTFAVSLQTSVELSRDAQPEAILISESGLNTRAELEELTRLGYKGFLIGESLMRARRPDQTLRDLMGG